MCIFIGPPVLWFSSHSLDLVLWPGQNLSLSLRTCGTQNPTYDLTVAWCLSITTSPAPSTALAVTELACSAIFDIRSYCGLPLCLLSTKSPRLSPMCCGSATSLLSLTQFDFWTQEQSPPFIPIKLHLVRCGLLFQPVEIILDPDPVSCLLFCFMSSANLISMLSMLSSKSSIERLDGTEARTQPWRSLEMTLQVAGDQSIHVHWALSFTLVPVHWVTLSSSHTLPSSLWHRRAYLFNCFADI